MRVTATRPGYYNNIYWRVGDQFDLNSPADFVDAALDPINGWMAQVGEIQQSNAQTPPQGVTANVPTDTA